MYNLINLYYILIYLLWRLNDDMNYYFVIYLLGITSYVSEMNLVCSYKISCWSRWEMNLSTAPKSNQCLVACGVRLVHPQTRIDKCGRLERVFDQILTSYA